MIDVDDYHDRIITVKFAGDAQPKYQSLGAAGCDVTSSEEVCVPKGGWALIPTGLYLEIPRGYECQVRSRSGLAAKDGVFVLNSPGTIDSDYRGELKLCLTYTAGSGGHYIRKGQAVAQIVIMPVLPVELVEVDALSTTERGAGGFGSTGK